MVFAASESYAEAAYSIPKGLQDIVQLINETPVDSKFREEGLNLIKVLPLLIYLITWLYFTTRD